MNLLGCAGDDESKDLKFRRQNNILTEVDSDSLPFISFVFKDADNTGNYLRNKGMLQIDIYCSVDYVAENIYNVVVPLVKQVDDIIIAAEGEAPTGITGIYRYRVRFQPLVNS